MESRSLTMSVRVFSLALLISSTCALAQERPPVHLTGLINDYVPLLATVKGSPYEMHGQWSMDIHPERGTADFSADMTMSSFGRTPDGVVDPTQPLQGPHTHHIKLTNAQITWNMDGCPTYATPTKTGFQMSKIVSLLTGNGSNGGFETTPPSSTLQVCVTGGLDTPFSMPISNITLVFSGPATGHFGTQAIHGVVRGAASDPGKDSR